MEKRTKRKNRWIEAAEKIPASKWNCEYLDGCRGGIDMGGTSGHSTSRYVYRTPLRMKSRDYLANFFVVSWSYTRDRSYGTHDRDDVARRPYEFIDRRSHALTVTTIAQRRVFKTEDEELLRDLAKKLRE